MPPTMRLTAINLDCPDPIALAAFYQKATGYEPHPKSDAEFAGLTREDGLFIGFQRVDDYRPPTWPDQIVPQQLHICFKTDDLPATAAHLLTLGATKPPHQQGEADGRWLVLLDPAGHPFCLVRG
ncbi:VOC family protein [Streptomyces sp. NPDC050738]|uniref:VOC family protein n=1 Tax=Streptomyces sp. NPDC050738 TaxID=3154744 RepID=UPI003442D382